LSSEYESESETSTGSTLSLYTSLLPILPPVSSLPSPINFPLSYDTISQHDLNAIIKQQQEQLAAIQAQIQALLVGEAVVGRVASTEVARPQIFDGTSSKVSGFVTACRLYIRIKIREVVVKEQI